MFDVIVVEAIDRLSRRLADIANFHDVIEFEKVKLHARGSWCRSRNCPWGRVRLRYSTSLRARAAKRRWQVRIFARAHDRKSSATIYDWRRYLAVIQRKPGALRNGAPFA